MRFHETGILGVRLIEAEPNSDPRGSFARFYCPEEFTAAGIDFAPVQVNLSRNLAAFTLRGMHYQGPPRAEAKLVHVTRGAIYDVALDLRPESPNYRCWTAARLDADSMTALFIPEGCAHGFLTLVPNTDVLYHMGRMFEPGWTRGVRWDDPAFAIDWPARPQVISDRDGGYPDFEA
jgi:dTDP-4-dehydrorhamnose 3,5-epimerase